MKQSLRSQILSILLQYIQTINTVLALFNVEWQIAVAPQFKRSSSMKRVWTDHLCFNTSDRNKHEWTSKGVLKERVELTEICILSYVLAQSVFQPRKDVKLAARKQ